MSSITARQAEPKEPVGVYAQVACRRVGAARLRLNEADGALRLLDLRRRALLKPSLFRAAAIHKLSMRVHDTVLVLF